MNNVLNFTLLVLAQFSSPAYAILYDQETEPVLYGKGFAPCDDELPTLSVASENIIQTKEEWDAFQAKNPFFVVGAADSTCEKCCDSEPLLLELQKVTKDKAIFSYPDVLKKKKKIVRKEIAVARIDLANKVLTEKLAAQGIWFPMGTTIQIGVNGRLLKYDGMFASVNMLLHHM